MERCPATNGGYRCHYKLGHRGWHFAIVLPNKYRCWEVTDAYRIAEAKWMTRRAAVARLRIDRVYKETLELFAKRRLAE